MDTDLIMQNLERIKKGELDPSSATSARRRAQTSPQRGEDMSFWDRTRAETGKLVKMMLPFSGVNEALRLREEAGVKPNMIDKTVGGVARGLSFNTQGLLGAVGEEVEARIAGTDAEDFGTRLDRSRERVAENSNLVGELIGMVGQGPGRWAFEGAEQAVRRAPLLGRATRARGFSGLSARASAAAAIGGSTTFAYSAAGGASMSEAGEDAIYGAMLSTGAQQIGEGLMALSQSPAFRELIRGKPLSSVADDIREALKIEYPGQFIKNLEDEELLDVEAILASAPEDATTIEALYAPMIKEVTERMNTAKQPGQRQMYEAMRLMNEYARDLAKAKIPQFRESARAAFGDPQVRSANAMQVAGKQIREELQPQYERALQEVPDQFRQPSGKPRPIKASDIDKVIDKYIKRAPKDANAAAMGKLIKGMITRTKGRGGTDVTRMTNRQLYRFLKQLDEHIYRGKIPNFQKLEEGMSYSRETLKTMLGPMRNELREILYQRAPKLRELDAQYSSEVRMRNAYEAGQQAFKGREGGTDAYDLFDVMADRTPAEHGAFAEGVKAEAMRQLEGKSPQAIANFLEKHPDKIALVQKIVGPEGMTDFRAALGRLSMQSEVAKTAMEGPPASASSTAARGNLLGTGVDLATILGGVGNVVSSAAALGAFRRQTVGGASHLPGRYGRAEALADVATMPAEQGLNTLNRGLLDLQPQATGGSRLVPPLVTGEPEQR